MTVHEPPIHADSEQSFLLLRQFAARQGVCSCGGERLFTKHMHPGNQSFLIDRRMHVVRQGIDYRVNTAKDRMIICTALALCTQGPCQ